MLPLYENIKRLRKERKWTQAELAEKTGYTHRSSIGKIEKGEVDLSQSKIKAFADVFGVTPQELMGYGSDPGRMVIEVTADTSRVDDKMWNSFKEIYAALSEESRKEVLEFMSTTLMLQTTRTKLFQDLEKLPDDEKEVVLRFINKDK